MKYIRLENFRCYSEQAITFKSGINLLVGDNATGKTSMLKACKYVLSAFFAGFSDDNTKWLNPNDSDFREEFADDILLQEKPIHITFDTKDTMETLYQTSFVEEEGYMNVLTKNSKKNSRSLIAGIKEYKSYATRLSQYYISTEGQQYALPLFAYFSTEDIHVPRKINRNKFKAYSHKPSFGYYECLEGDGFFDYWIYRLLVLQEGRESSPEITIVRKAIQKALGTDGCNIVQDIQIRPIQKKVYFIFTDGREVEADYLSDGYKRLINIVMDIAFRCAFLNRGIYGEETCQRTKGTVVIDEVDLHLHPTMQAVVLNSLRSAFPNLQFIVSSHAPMVMSGVESNEENVVYKLGYSNENYTVEEIVTFGMDLSTISKRVLNVPPRDVKVAADLKELFALIDNEENESARALLQKLRAKYKRELPDFVEAEAMLNFSIFADETDN